MNQSKEIRIDRYFAAANTYNGFKSHFNELFNSKNYDRIYVLKGGPGTGKSSFMKEVAELFSKNKCATERIYCSSDPSSLDGVIIEYNNKKIAILDGTAPHERDAVVPGAADELINLGEGWDKSWLTAQRESIYRINLEKKKSYETAYSYLKIAGKSNDAICSVLQSSFNKIKAKNWAEGILSVTDACTGVVKNRLLGSFGKYGEYYPEWSFDKDIEAVKVSGDKTAAGMLLHYLFDRLLSSETGFVHSPSPLSPNLSDGIFIADKVIIRDKNGELSADEFFNISEQDKERIKRARFIHEEALEEAKRHFSIASEMHFELEKIYGEAMNFGLIDQIKEEKITEIANILEISL